MHCRESQIALTVGYYSSDHPNTPECYLRSLPFCCNYSRRLRSWRMKIKRLMMSK